MKVRQHYRWDGNVRVACRCTIGVEHSVPPIFEEGVTA